MIDQLQEITGIGDVQVLSRALDNSARAGEYDVSRAVELLVGMDQCRAPDQPDATAAQPDVTVVGEVGGRGRDSWWVGVDVQCEDVACAASS